MNYPDYGCHVKMAHPVSLRWLKTGALIERYGIMLTRARPDFGIDPAFWCAHWISQAEERQEADISPHAAVSRLFEALKADGLIKEST